ncbi:hypothetical protein Tco_0088911 [Tanacetum coccineum]
MANSYNDYGSNEPSFNDGSADWSDPQEHGFGDSFSKEVRLRSLEMLETDGMQNLLRSFGIGATGPAYGLYDNDSYSIMFLMSQRWAQYMHKGPGAVEGRRLLVGSN